MSILPTWPISAGTLVIGFALGVTGTAWVKNAKIDRITAAHAEESRQREAVRASDELVARAKEQTLVENAGRREQETQNAISRLTIERDTLAVSLRNRPERPARPSGASPAAPTCQGATGAELYRGDGEFLVRYASRAETHRIELGKCYAQYDDARAQLSAYANATRANDTAARPQNAANR